MIPRTSHDSSKTLHLCLVMVCLAVFAVPAFAETTNVVIRDNVPIAKRDELIRTLRSITGFQNLRFDAQGGLQLGANYDKGSTIARALLSRAVSGDKVVVIEDASGRADVAFCRVVPGRWRTDRDTKVSAFVVLVDFSDFRKIVGDDEARAAFDVGWGFLHELDHVVSDSTDAEEQGKLGECEKHINEMRLEVGLPVRVDYFFTQSSLRPDPNFGNKLVKLAFEQYDHETSRKKRYWLVWDSNAVGGLLAKTQTAMVRAAPKTKN